MAKKRPSEEDRVEALQRFLSGLARGDDVSELSLSLMDLHPRNDTFPGEVLMRLAADALEVAGIGQETPIPYEGLREKFLPECEFRGRENRKIQFAILASASLRGGVEPDLLDEVVCWRTDDFWTYALLAAVALIRSCADSEGVPVATLVERLAVRYELPLR